MSRGNIASPEAQASGFEVFRPVEDPLSDRAWTLIAEALGESRSSDPMYLAGMVAALAKRQDRQSAASDFDQRAREQAAMSAVLTVAAELREAGAQLECAAEQLKRAGIGVWASRVHLASKRALEAAESIAGGAK